MSTKSLTDLRGVTRRRFLTNGLAIAGSFIVGGVPSQAKQFLAKSVRRTIDVSDLKKTFKGEVLVRGDAEFSKAALGDLWNRLVPKRLPDVIARVANEDDVVTVVKWAKAKKMKVAVRGGGHNWCCPSLRTSGILIDLANLNKVISIDEEKRSAVTQPIVSNREMQAALNAKGMSYPTGHCPPVKMSGYLLSGGMSWNQGEWGPGVGSIEGIEMVTADGARITANKSQNQDYFWAARGAGPGFFAVAVRYHLKLYPLPKAITCSSQFYNIDEVGTIAEWLENIAPRLSNKIELSLFVLTAPKSIADKCKADNGKACLFTATCFADSKEEAEAALKPFENSPIISKCLQMETYKPYTFDQLFDASAAMWPADQRSHVEAMFSNSKLKDLFQAIVPHFKKTPNPTTLVLFAIFTGPNVPAPLLDAAFSMSAHYYGGPWTQWTDPKDDAVNSEWHKEMLNLLKPFTVGHYISESDTVTYPTHVLESYTATNWKKLNDLRKKYDPTGVFFNYFDGLT